MSARSTANLLRDSIRERLQSIEAQAIQARRLSVKSDNLCDVLDDIDNDLQAVIELVKRVRGGEAQ